MSANGLELFDKTIHTTNIWLKEIGQGIGPDRQLAWKVLSVVLHKLRDRLPVEVAAHLGAQLPILVRGVYYDQFQPARQPGDCRGSLPRSIREIWEAAEETPSLAERKGAKATDKGVALGM